MKKIFLTLLLVCLSFNVNAITSNYTTFTDGSVVNASDLNGLQQNYTDADNAILNGDIFTGNMLWHSGADAIWYTDTGSTLSAKILGDTGEIIAANTQQGFISNCGITYTSGTLSIADRSLTALSATNPCYIAVRSDTTGATDIAKFTANVTVTDGAASQTDGNLYGISDVNWGNPMPGFIGVIDFGTNDYFTWSRIAISESGTAGQLCQLADTDCDDQNDVMILATGLTLASYTGKPITQVGWITQTYATAGGAWTFSVSSGEEGFNKNYKENQFNMPLAQNGAATGTYFAENGGTAPLFTTNPYVYYFDDNGMVCVFIDLASDPGTDGVGAVISYISLPFKTVSISGATELYGGHFLVESVGGAATNQFTIAVAQTTDPRFFMYESGGGVMQNGDFSNGARGVRGSFCYPIF